ncbi:hypothetical protein A4X06_0g6251 [Tilletia controversa]|uniref:Uncharacterized protein n=1 Tax=Tilletia controversa TaxID=13291 RepID=A0A8X7MQH7_9BASI|nr:hypothetical protein A4X06_0g6251 [Tilletia controversa]
MSKFKAAKFAKRITKLEENVWDMCPQSCMAFVGPHAHLRRCNTIRDGQRCGAERYNSNNKAKRTFTTIPILPRARAKWAAGTGSIYAQERATQAEQNLRPGVADPRHVFLDFGDGAVMNLLRERGVLLRDGEEAYMLSVDGAQMVDRKESNGWIVLFSCLNTRPSTRFRRQGTFVASVIPGPQNPVNVGSFLYPIMQEFAKASKGHWLWDGNERQRFLWKAYLVFAAADQPGSQKINHMTGTSGFSGCRICHMVANYLPGDGQVTGYFPIKSTGSESDPPINADRPEYDPEELPLRTERSYIDALDELDGCLTRAERAETRKLNGVSSRPLLSASPAFVMPSFFPIDIFHLFGVNLPSLIWDTFTHAKPGDPFTLSEEQTTFFASILKKAGTDLPSSFSSGLPRDPTEFSKSYYKMFEWSLVLYTYLPPFLLAIDAPDQIIEMIDHLQSGLRLASSIHGCSEAQRQQTKHHFIGFCKLWEALYIRDQPDLIYRATISVHYLLHVSDFIWWHGSLIISSQARCEREAGLIKKSVRSHKAVFANILNNVLSREHLRILDIILNDQEAPEPADHFLLTVRHTRTHLNLTQDERTRQEELIQALDNGGGTIVRGKLALPSGHVIRGSRIDSNSRRKACRFMARDLEGTTYAEAIHFMCFDGHRISDGEDAEVNANKVYVLARPLVGVQTGGGLVRGDDFRERLYLVDASTILQPVGILKLGGFIYVLQKLSWLNER